MVPYPHRRRSPHSIFTSSEVPTLFDHLVGAAEQCERERKTEHLCGFHVDDQLDVHRLLDWEVGRLFTIENPARVDAHLAIGIPQTGSVAHKTARGSVIAECINRGDRMVRRQRDQLRASAIEKCIALYAK